MTEFVWLIEAPGPRFLAVRKVTTMRDFCWTDDHNLALQFRSQEQADLTMGALRQLAPNLFGFEATLGNARAAEHGWLAPPVRTPEQFQRAADQDR